MFSISHIFSLENQTSNWIKSQHIIYEYYIKLQNIIFYVYMQSYNLSKWYDMCIICFFLLIIQEFSELGLNIHIGNKIIKAGVGIQTLSTYQVPSEEK